MIAAAALELFHAFALIHDDTLGRGDRRRGRPSMHPTFADLHAPSSWPGEDRADDPSTRRHRAPRSRPPRWPRRAAARWPSWPTGRCDGCDDRREIRRIRAVPAGWAG
ncbi:polyprenyl synthetase family protein [Actinoplanes aureus]|uniref:polyprenyl synthetase family protein n=1 Tax=Actinoplanes aureus TaxID=2792083 RepID=UPI00281674F3|nr:polyprenyl synthetase family protein [Actinoplanes aureus]